MLIKKKCTEALYEEEKDSYYVSDTAFMWVNPFEPSGWKYLKILQGYHLKSDDYLVVTVGF